MTTFGQEGRPAPTGTVRVERRAAWLALVVVAVLLGGCASPTGGGSPGTGSGSVPTAISSLAPSASVAGATPSSSAVPSVEAAIGQPADDGARITGIDRLGPRSRDITIDSPAVGIRTVRLLVPASFETQTTRRWPVLYLLHGATGSHSDWMEYTDVEALTNATDLIIAMPDGGEFGFYSDWWNGGSGGMPMWETFHTMELPQLLERNWHASDKRVVAGLSMGGYGALEYAARFPGTYLAAASYSGAVDPIGGDARHRDDRPVGRSSRAGRHLEGPRPGAHRRRLEGYEAVRLLR